MVIYILLYILLNFPAHMAQDKVNTFNAFYELNIFYSWNLQNSPFKHPQWSGILPAHTRFARDALLDHPVPVWTPRSPLGRVAARLFRKRKNAPLINLSILRVQTLQSNFHQSQQQSLILLMLIENKDKLLQLLLLYNLMQK